MELDRKLFNRKTLVKTLNYVQKGNSEEENVKEINCRKDFIFTCRNSFGMVTTENAV